jgi:hypothetical protein
MSKELYIAAHEELIEEYLEHHPECSEQQAYDDTADAAYDRMRENMADMIDRVRLARKDSM